MYVIYSYNMIWYAGKSIQEQSLDLDPFSKKYLSWRGWRMLTYADVCWRMLYAGKSIQEQSLDLDLFDKKYLQDKNDENKIK